MILMLVTKYIELSYSGSYIVDVPLRGRSELLGGRGGAIFFSDNPPPLPEPNVIFRVLPVFPDSLGR